jgi:hypothetical protein
MKNSRGEGESGGMGLMTALHSGGACAKSYFFTHQFSDDNFGSSVAVCGFDTQPVGGKIIYKDNATCVFRKKAAFSVAGQLGRVFRPVFVKGIVFFISHIGHGSLLLLLFEQRQESISALHGMKYFQILLINYIIHNFQQICIIVKPYQQVFFRLIFKYIVVFPVQYGMTDISLSYAMFERGRNTFDDDFHRVNITQKTTGSK